MPLHQDSQDMHRLISSGCAKFINGELYYFVFTEISIESLKSASDGYTSFDVILFQFDPSSVNALEHLRRLNQLLPELPRMFVVFNRGNITYEEEIRNARIYVESVERAKFCALENIDSDVVNSNEALDEMCVEILGLLVDTNQGVPLSSGSSYTLSTVHQMSSLIPPLFILIGIMFSVYKLKNLRVSVMKGLKHFLHFSEGKD
jgi:hypothetical protein